MNILKHDRLKLKGRVRRGTSFLLAVLMVISAIAPGTVSTYNAYGASPDDVLSDVEGTPNGNKPEDTLYTEETYINDTPLRLQVSKVKTAQGDHEGLNPETVETELEDTITYKVSGRVDGSITDLINRYGSGNVEFAYDPYGSYLGYGWLTGTLEYLTQRKAQQVPGETVDIKYNARGVFEGYAYVTRKLETADDVNRYVAGATMTLYDAVEIFYDPSVDYDQDDKFKGVTVERDDSGNVQMVYVNKGYAGTRTEYVLQKDDPDKVEMDENGTVIDNNYNYQDSINDDGEGVWIAKTIQREDTPILFYSFDDLHVTSNDLYTTPDSENRKLLDDVFGAERFNKEDVLYAFDKEGNVINAEQYMNRDFSIYAFEDGENKPVFEFTGSDFHNIHYSQVEKMFRFEDEDGNVDKEMRMYHLDEDGNRDAMVDPTTGIAYLIEQIQPLAGQDSPEDTSHDNTHYTNEGFLSDSNIKIFVWPVNTFYDGTGNGDGNANGSHYFQKIITTRPATINADTADEYVFGTLKGDKFENSLNPVLDQYGHPVYNRVSEDTYVKGEDRYDYDGEEYLGYTYADGLDAWNENAYVINDHNTLYNTDKDDPFNQETHYQYTDKQSIKITVDMDNNFVVNGASVVPVPTRSGYVFAGWLVDPNQLYDGAEINAYWRNGNGSMSQDDKDMWYSDRQAASTNVQTFTVTFNAYGGQFRAGQGDIHSTDYPLYRRLGDAYIINNTWVTGENTPNDPFDDPLVDTVENTADGTNTYTAQSKTANDVYSNDTKAGGQADMLKRLDRSLYIMEELEAPAGYVKGMPVPITMNEMTDVQFAEMTDQTIKVEIVKVDAPDETVGRELNQRRNGTVVQEPGGQYVTKTEPKGSYSYKHVPHATLTMEGKDQDTRKAFSDWVKVTSDTDFTKRQDGSGSWYIEFDSSTPLFLEGIPAGTYTIKEVGTPDGYVTMAPQTITVGEYEGVQLFGMSDEHIKVEIEKYWTDEDGTRHLLPNSDRAELGLFNENGDQIATWLTDDASDYVGGGAAGGSSGGNLITRAIRAIAGFFGISNQSSNIANADFTSFVEHYRQSLNDHGTEFNQISWTVKRTATLQPGSTDGSEVWKLSDGTTVTVTGDVIPEDAPAGFAEIYPSEAGAVESFDYAETLTATKDEAASTGLGEQYWNVSNGTKMHICVSADDASSSSSGYQSYTVDYQFDYRKLDGNAVTYLTVDGTRRFDYLPKGKYTIRELKVPTGYAAAADKEITVEETADIQIFDIENKKRELKLSKYVMDGQAAPQYFAGYYDNDVHYSYEASQAVVVAGANLELYRSATQIADPKTAFRDGAVPAGAVLVDKWTSGSDGSYTQYEYERELIRKELVGQLKPHTFKDVQDGWYYLVERSAMSYMRVSDPVELHVTAETTDETMAAYAMTNKPAVLTVRIHKTGDEDQPLEGATFELTNKDTGAVVGTLTTGADGNATMNVGDIGRIGSDGHIIPYTFVVKETLAPAGYVVDPTPHEFTPADKGDGTLVMENVKDADIRDGVLYVTDEPSMISVSKQDFFSHETVPGTVLEMTEAEFVNDGDDGAKWQSTGEKRDEWSWTVQEGEQEFGLKGVAPGHSYVLHEVSVPQGYSFHDDVFFRISNDGRNIDKIWTDPYEAQYVSFDVNDAGEVKAMRVSTRKVSGTSAVLYDTESGSPVGGLGNIGVGTDGTVLLTGNDVEEGHVYTIKTFVTMSDNHTYCVDTVTFLAALTDGVMEVPVQYATGAKLTLKDADETTIFEIDEDGNEMVTMNPKIAQGALLAVADVSNAGKDHAGVKVGDVISYQLTYTGVGQKITISASDGLTISRTDERFVPNGDGTYTYTTPDEYGVLSFTANVMANALTDVSLNMTCGPMSQTYLNPVITNGVADIYAHNASLVISNAMTGTDPGNGTTEFNYTIALTDKDGGALKGSYDYRTKNGSGLFQAFGKDKEFTVTLTGDDYLVLLDLPSETHYKVSMSPVVPGTFENSRKTAEGVTNGLLTVNELFDHARDMQADRVPLKKNQSYYLDEAVIMIGRSHTISGYGFALDDKYRVVRFILLNSHTDVEVEKLARDTGEMLSGAVLTITDADGNTVKDAEGNALTWTTDGQIKVFDGILEAGQTYYLKELSAPDGYAKSEPIPFIVSKDGAVDRIVMLDKETEVEFRKTDSVTGESLAGATLQVIDKDGNVIESWETDDTGVFKLKTRLKAGETYTLHEEKTVHGYYYSYDVPFTVNEDGESQVVVMRNRPIIVVNPEDFPKEPENPGEKPSYTMEKERVSLAPEKKDTDPKKFGFFRGDRVLYDVTITNTGETSLTMNVDDVFEIPGYFTTPNVVSVTYYKGASTVPDMKMGRTNAIHGNTANITLEIGARAVVRYEAYVQMHTPESLSNAAKDDGLGYLNTAHTTDVTAVVHVYSGDDNDGDGKGDTVRQKTVTKDDFPELGDKEDTANTPVQVPEEPEPQNPSYTMDKERTTPASEKDNTGTYGFFHGQTVKYETRIRNTGNMPLEMYVSDEFAEPVAAYFENLQIISITGCKNISGADEGVGHTVAKIRLEPGEEAVVTFTAKVSDDAPENLSLSASDDGYGYLNIAKTYDVKAIDEDGHPHGDDEYPEIPDKEDEAHTPVQESGQNPDYEMNKVRVTPAPLKKGTDPEKYGFYRGDRVLYDVTLRNTGDTRLTMNVDDVFVDTSYFTLPEVIGVTYYNGNDTTPSMDMGQTNSVSGNKANITIEVGGRAVVRYEAYVLQDTPENLSDHTEDDGMGYQNIAHTTDVTTVITERSGEDEDNDGLPDNVVEKTVDKDDFPQLEDKQDDAHTPVQEPEEPEPSYSMDKERTSPAPAKGQTKTYGFHRGETVTYEVHITNTGELGLDMHVSDAFDEAIAQYFRDLKITKIEGGQDISDAAAQEGIGYTVAKVRMRPGESVTVTYTAVVADDAPESLSYTAKDDGNGYLNVARTYDVHSWHPDNPDEPGPDGPDDEDEAHTPVQEGGNNPSYTMDKKRVSLAPAKKDTEQFGFFHGDKVLYDVTVTNTGDTQLTMDVDDAFEIPKNFTTPKIESVVFYEGEAPSVTAGHTNRITGSKANITIEIGGRAVIRYSAVVLNDTPEFLSNSTEDDGLGYLNTATTKNVTAVVTEYKDEDGDGTPDKITEKTVTKDDYPQLEDKEDDANTPVQVPETPEEPEPSYTMDKDRPTPAPEKGDTGTYGFHRGETVTYEVHITNTGNMPLEMDVSDEFDKDIAQYFNDLRITAVDGCSIIEQDGMGIGQTAVKIRLEPGASATVTYTAVVSDDAPENLSYSFRDDGLGYLNTAYTRNVRAIGPDGEPHGPDEYPGIPNKEDDAHTPVQESTGKPGYTMDKKRVEDAPLKAGTEPAMYGFFRGDTVHYDVTIRNTGGTRLTMDVDDAFEKSEYFSKPQVVSVLFYEGDATEPSMAMGRANSIHGSVANITIEVGGRAVVRYAADVLQDTPEYLAGTTADDKAVLDDGYLNTATTTDVTTVIREYSGEDKDGDGKGDHVTEKTVTKDDFPDELGDQEDTANTPVQVPKDENPSYTMSKDRPTPAPPKGETSRYGFHRGDTVTYKAYITNTGTMTLKMHVSDAFASDIAQYFDNLQITKIDGGRDVSEAGEGVGHTVAQIRIEPGETVVITYTAVVKNNAPENLSFMARDDGYGYLNTVKTYDVKAIDENGKEHGPEEYPELHDKEDDAHTPVQEPDDNPEYYPFIWLVKGDKALEGTVGMPVLPGGSYQVIDKLDDGTEVVMMEITDPDGDGKFVMEGSWKQWDYVLDADKTYYLRETKAPAGYILAEEDTPFTVSHYGEDVVAPIYNEKTKVSFEKTDFEGNEIAGAQCAIYVMRETGWDLVDSWTSEVGSVHTLEGVLEAGKDYLYKETGAPDGYAFAISIRFTLGQDGKVTHARYVNENGKTVVYGSDGHPTAVTVTETLAGTTYMLDGEALSMAGGNLVDKAGKVVVEGATVDLPIEDNVVVMKDEPIEAFFEKTDFDGNEVAGATYTLSERMPDGTDRQIDEWVSGENDGAHKLAEPLSAGKTYLYHEKQAPDGYGYGYDLEFTVEPDGTIKSMHYLDPDGNVVLQDGDGFPTDIVAKDDGTYRQGSHTITINENGDAVDEKGNVVARGVRKEIPVENNLVSMPDEPIKVVFLKYDEDGNALEGGSFSIIGDGGEVVRAIRDTLIPSLEHEGMIRRGEELTFAADADGVRIDALLLAGESYAVKENEAPEGYAVSGAQPRFTAPWYNQKAAVSVTMSDKKTLVRFEKVDGTGAPLEGASLELYVQAADGQDQWELVYAWESTKEPITLEGVLEAGRTYCYHEEKAPEGYRLAEDIYFTVGVDGVISEAHAGSIHGAVIAVTDNTVSMTDPTGNPKFSKVDLAGVELAGATVAVYRKAADGSLKQIGDAWTTSGKPHVLSEDLEAGATYIYRELQAPKGYAYSADIEFVMGGDNNVARAHYVNANGETVLYDKDGYVTDITVQADGTYKSGDSVVTVNGNGDAYAADGTFIAAGVKEEIPVAGNIIVMRDVPTGVTFKKEDAVTGKSLAGATLQVLDKDRNVLSEWVTDDTGVFKLEQALNPGETYTLHEEKTVEGYYYSYDVQFTVNEDGQPQIVEMHNRPIIVVTPPDEYPGPDPDPQGTHPDYELEKERVSLAPNKKDTSQFGFFRGDRVLYDVTVTNTGETDLEMTVTDTFEIAEYFSEPRATGVRFFYKDGREGTTMGSIISLSGNQAKIHLAVGGYAVIRYEADVLPAAKEFLSDHAKDDGLGYLNTARSTDVVGKYTVYTGDDNDGDGKGDTPEEKTVTKDDYPEELGDKEDAANTPVQEPKEGGENPSYTMDKSRPTPAPAKDGTGMFGFFRGDSVDYDVHITNTGDMPLTMYVTDEFDYRIARYFSVPKIKKVDGRIIPEDGTGIGTDTVKISLDVGEEAVVTFTATVLETAPEKLAYFAEDDGNGYLNIAKTYHVRAQKPDGTEGGPDEYPGIPDKEDEAHTPVQTDEPKPDYPFIWLLKNSIEDPDHILVGGTFQVLSEDKSQVLIDEFTMNSTWQQWGPVLEADKTYWLHEVTPPEGYDHAEDVKFTVSHYGEDIQVTMTDELKETEASFAKVDLEGAGVAGAECELRLVDPNGAAVTVVDSWTSNGRPHKVTGLLERGSVYRYHEAKAPEGYGWSKDIEFTVDETGTIVGAHYVDRDGLPVLYDKDGIATDIVVLEDGSYRLGNEKVTVNENGAAVGSDGSIIAEGVRYEVPADGNLIRMIDVPTNVLFKKVSSSGTALTGGRFVIVTEDGTVVKASADTQIPSTEHEGNIRKGEALRFAATAGGVEITGLLTSGTTYMLREEVAPSGYNKASDVKFTVPRDGRTITVTMTDTKTPHEPHEPHEPNEPTKPGVTVYKYDGTTMQPIGGVTFRVYRNGAEWTSITTAANGYASLNSLEDGTYRIVETAAPAGYRTATQEFNFVVSGHVVVGGVTMFHVANYKEPDVTIYKRDAETGELLRGATLQVVAEDGNVVYSGTTGSSGTITVKGLKPGHYAVIEVKAPSGYEVNDGYITFHVAEDGTVTGSTTLYDYKKEPKKTKGKITAIYENSTARGGWYDSEGVWHPLPPTGDDGGPSVLPYLVIMAAATAVAAVLLKRRKKKPGEGASEGGSEGDESSES